MDTDRSLISVDELCRLLGTAAAPRVIDIRYTVEDAAEARAVPASVRADPDEADHWAIYLRARERVVVCSPDGGKDGAQAAQRLIALGFDAASLTGGLLAWRAAGCPTMDAARGQRRVDAAPSRWVTRARPKIDRIACPWLIRRFVDPDATILYVPAAEVRQIAARAGATPFDVPGVAFGHFGDMCSFDAFLAAFAIDDAALTDLAAVVRGADTGRPDLSPQAHGLLAISYGLSALYADDHEMLQHGLIIYDALYAWHRENRRMAGSVPS